MYMDETRLITLCDQGDRMPVPTVVRIEVLVVAYTSAGLLLLEENSGGPGAPSYAFPGVPVGDGESVVDALERALAHLAVPEHGEPEYAGCVEYGTPGGPEQHTLTLLYAVSVAGNPEAARADGRAIAVVDPAALPTLPGLHADLASAVGWWWEEACWPVWQGLPVPEPDPWWDGLRQSVRTIRAQLAARRAELDDIGFRDAAVAMCALVAAADGTISPQERNAMVSAMAADDVLSQFDRVTLTRLFDGHVARFRGEGGTARRATLREIAKVRGRPVQARAVVRLGAVIGRADGVFDPSEQAAVVAAARVLGVEAWALAAQAAASDPPEPDTGDHGYDDEGTDDGRSQA
jgi:tellurite resistance protein/ADP-ribose pyrophosphatase YjhB (NUDIX family)